MIPTNRQERYDTFVSDMKNRWHYPANSSAWDELFDYLENENVPIPLHQSVYDTWGFSDIYSLLEHPERWETFDERIMEMMANFWATPTSFNSDHLSPKSLIAVWLHNYDASHIDLPTLQSMGYVLEKYTINEGYLAIHLLNFSFNRYDIAPPEQYILDNVGKILSILPNIEHRAFFQLLLKYDEPTLDKYLEQLIVSLHQPSIIGLDNIELLLAYKAEKYEKYLVNIAKDATQPPQALRVFLLLNEHFPQKYTTEIVQLCYKYLDSLKPQFVFDWYNNEKTNYHGHLINIVFTLLIELEPIDMAFNAIQKFLRECPHVTSGIIEIVYNGFGERSLPLLVELLTKDEFTSNNYYGGRNFENTLLNCLKKHDNEALYPQLWRLTRHKSKKLRLLVAEYLEMKQGEAAIPNAEKLLQDKKADMRFVGVWILVGIKTEKALLPLKAILNSETNDEARDYIRGLIPIESDFETLMETIEHAKTRKKLDKPLVEWLNTEGVDYPKLYWLSGKIVEATALNFLFYRMNRVNSMDSIDSEAKAFLAHIDTSRRGNFAKFLLKKYFDNGADPKLKWCMILAALWGDDSVIDMFKHKTNEWVEANRSLMAESAIKALSMNGSIKALRILDFFSRKYKTKSVGDSASRAFTLAAKNLEMSPYDLADAIIPDFGFEGLFRTFDVAGETYRAFIDNKFKIAFLNEGNSLLKTIPKGASTELATEFKAISKEIRDIVKAQSSRLEQYLVAQRKWTVQKWDTFFRGNPVMFTYSIRLIWGVFDEKQHLLTTFQCLEDQTLVNIEGDELDLDDYTEGYQIGMIHPLSLPLETRTHWKNSLTDAGLQPIFPQLDRPAIHLKEADKHLKRCTDFNGIQLGGYAFVGKMEKSGWERGEIGDGGGILSYCKSFVDLGVQAVITQVGCLSVGYYEVEAELGDLTFERSNFYGLGSDGRLISLCDVPPIVYSEVMGDLLFFKSN